MGSQGINFVILGTFTCLIPQTFVCLSCGLKIVGSQGINFVILGTFTCLIPQTFVCLSCGLKKITIKQKQVLTCLPPFPLKFHANPVCVDICYYNYNYFDYYYFCYYSQIISIVFLVRLKFQFVTFYHFRYFYIHIILD